MKIVGAHIPLMSKLGYSYYIYSDHIQFLMICWGWGKKHFNRATNTPALAAPSPYIAGLYLIQV